MGLAKRHHHIAERRIDRMLDHTRSQGLPPFLADDPGVDSGLMIGHYTAAALASANKGLAAPASVDSLPTSGMQEDHVSMAWGAARKLLKMIDNVRRILAVEATVAARAIDLRAPLEPAAGTGAAAAGEAAARSLLLGGAPMRFPELRWAFLEGGVAWGANLLGDAIAHFAKRNGIAIAHYDPAELDRTTLIELFHRHADKAVIDGALAMAWTAIEIATDMKLRERLLQQSPAEA